MLAEHDDLVMRPRTTDGVETTWMMYPFVLADDVERTPAQKFFWRRDVPTRMVWSGNILRQPGFASMPHRVPDDGLPNADRVMDHGLTLPSHHGLTSDAVGHIAESLSEKPLPRAQLG